MKALPVQLESDLYDHSQHVRADLWTFEFPDAVRRWTTYPTPITYGGNTWSVGPGINLNSDVRVESGLSVDGLSLEVYPDSTLIAGLSMVQAAARGLWRGSRVVLQRAFMVASGDVSSGLVTEFVGFVSTAEVGATSIRVSIKSASSRLSATIPRRSVMPQCPWTLGDAMCTVPLASYVQTRGVLAESTAAVVKLDAAASYAETGGKLRLYETAGGRMIAEAQIRSVAGPDVTLTVPLPIAPVPGHSVEVVRLCNKTIAMCRDRYANLINFGGSPDMPRSETV